jgi:hypothetical protein
MIYGEWECLVTLMIWDVLFYSHKKIKRLLYIKVQQFDFMLRWLLVSADKISVTDKFCAHRYPKTFLWILKFFLIQSESIVFRKGKFTRLPVSLS